MKSKSEILARIEELKDKIWYYYHKVLTNQVWPSAKIPAEALAKATALEKKYHKFHLALLSNVSVMTLESEIAALEWVIS